MRLKLALLLLGASLVLPAQTKMTVQQLVTFIKSAVQLKQPDKEVANYLRRITLSERLEQSTVEELQGEGAGAKTVEALHALCDTTANLPKANLPKPAPSLPVPEAAPMPPPSDYEQKEVLSKVRDYAMNYTRRLPDFLCTQVTRRYLDPSGLEFWRQMDTLTARVSYSDKHENYKLVLVNNRMVEDLPYMGVGGAISTGEFGSMLKEIFEPQTDADFHWERWGKLRGRITHVFRYRVEQPRSKWHVTYEKSDDIVPGYLGLIYVDRDAPVVMRVTLEAELPASFPIQQVTDTLDYDLAPIGTQQYMLPLKAVVRMREAKNLVKNEVEFRLYRKFSAESAIKFDDVSTPEPLPEDKTKEEAPK